MQLNGHQGQSSDAILIACTGKTQGQEHAYHMAAENGCMHHYFTSSHVTVWFVLCAMLCMNKKSYDKEKLITDSKGCQYLFYTRSKGKKKRKKEKQKGMRQYRN